jgi:membrane-bound ClpP family serine protease
MYLALTFLLLGVFFIYLEFFLPGMIMAFGGSILILAGGATLYFYHYSIWYLVCYFFIALLFILLACQLALYQMKQVFVKNQFYLQKDQEGFQACLYEKELIGKNGMAATDLRPSGHILIHETFFPAISKTGYIEKGSYVEVIGGEGAHLFVKIKKE